MNPLNTGLVLLACAALVVCLGFLARIKRAQVARWDHAQKAFYRHAAHLVETPQVPDELVRFVEFLSSLLGRKSALILMTVLALTERGKISGKRPRSRLLDIADRLPHRLHESFFAALDAFFTSLGWRSLFLGWLFRWATRPVRKPKNNGDHGAAELHLVEVACARAAA